MNTTLPRLVIAGTHSGSGKTTVSTALMAALNQTHWVQAFKVGPDYIDPSFHSFITGRPSRNLDSWLLEEHTMQQLFGRNAARAMMGDSAGVSIIEGVMGLFDGQASTNLGSTAHVAELLQAPVVLVLTASGMSRSAAAMVQGYKNFSSSVNVAGVILNKISSQRHYDILRDCIEGQAALPCLGYLPKNDAFELKRRHLGLVPSAEVADLKTKVELMQEEAAKYLDLNAILKLANAAEPLEIERTLVNKSVPQIELCTVSANDCNETAVKLCGKLAGANTASVPLTTESTIRIAVAKDKAFSFYYQDNLDVLRQFGAELVPFSPLGDEKLPENIAGLYLGGGFPEVYAEELSKNTRMLTSIKVALDNGLPSYAECGGMLYLSQSLINQEQESFKMVGFFDFSAEMTKKIGNFGYVEIEFLKNTTVALQGKKIKAHEFHYSHIINIGNIEPVLKITKSDGRGWSGGFYKQNTFAAYPHIHFYSDLSVAKQFVTSCCKFIGKEV